MNVIKHGGTIVRQGIARASLSMFLNWRTQNVPYRRLCRCKLINTSASWRLKIGPNKLRLLTLILEKECDYDRLCRVVHTNSVEKNFLETQWRTTVGAPPTSVHVAVESAASLRGPQIYDGPIWSFEVCTQSFTAQQSLITIRYMPLISSRICKWQPFVDSCAGRWCSCKRTLN